MRFVPIFSAVISGQEMLYITYKIEEESPINKVIGNLYKDGASIIDPILAITGINPSYSQRNSMVLFKLESNKHFQIEENTDKLKIVSRIDREALCTEENKCCTREDDCFIEFIVYLVEKSIKTTQSSSDTQKTLGYFNIKISVSDINDNSPQFTQFTQISSISMPMNSVHSQSISMEKYLNPTSSTNTQIPVIHVQILENSTAGTTVKIATATDLDIGINARITFLMENAQYTSPIFTVREGIFFCLTI